MGDMWEGLLHLKQVEGIVHVDEHSKEHKGRRAYKVKVDLGEGHSHEQIPRTTSWYVLLNPAYPLGSISFYPAESGGIIDTWPHQERNSASPTREVPWRGGKPCLEYFGSNLDDELTSDEPAGVERLAWHGRRLVQWLRTATNGMLVRPGDALEYPPYRRESGTLLGYVGRDFQPSSPPTWAKSGTIGTIDLLVGPNYWNTRVYYISRRNPNAAEEIRWNQNSVRAKKHEKGVWVATSSIPYKSPWAPIETFTELDEFLVSNRSSLEAVLGKMPRSAWRSERAFVLIVAQTPRKHDQTPDYLTWHGIRLKPKKLAIKSRRGGPMFARQAAIALKSKQQSIEWMNAWDFASRQHESRGSLEEDLLKAKVGIIGCGTLGSHVAEFLARGGVRDFFLIDYDDMEFGNLVRHELTACSVGHAKALSMAQRLESLHPLLQATPLEKRVSDLSEEEWKRLEECDIVLNLSADPFVDGFLARRSWSPTATLVRGVITIGAEHLLMDVQIGPMWDVAKTDDLRQQHADLLTKGKEAAIQSHGSIGCWNPSFPAMDYEVAARAADLVRHMNVHGPTEAQACYPSCGSCGS